MQYATLHGFGTRQLNGSCYESHAKMLNTRVIIGYSRVKSWSMPKLKQTALIEFYGSSCFPPDCGSNGTTRQVNVLSNRPSPITQEIETFLRSGGFATKNFFCYLSVEVVANAKIGQKHHHH